MFEPNWINVFSDGFNDRKSIFWLVSGNGEDACFACLPAEKLTTEVFLL